MKLPFRLSLLIALVIAVPSSSIQAGPDKNPWRAEISVRSTVGTWEIAFERQPYYGDVEGYLYDKLHTRTSKIGITYGPRAKIYYGSLFLSAEVEFGDFRYHGTGSSNMQTANFEFGWAELSDKSANIHLFLAYRWFRADVDSLNPLIRDHSVNSIGLGLAFGAPRASSFRWSIEGTVIPLSLLPSLFDWDRISGSDMAMSVAAIIGYKSNRSRLFIDLGYHFSIFDGILEAREKVEYNSILSVRHGVLLRAGY